METKDRGTNGFGIWLKCMLAEWNMKQTDLADALDVADVTISRWASGDRWPKEEYLRAVLDYFDCHLEIVPNEH